jgi:hypothetical protein
LSIIPEKKSRYLMPVLIPLAITTGFYIDYIIREFKNSKLKKDIFPVYFQFGLIGSIALLFWTIWFFSSSVLTGQLLVRFVITSITLLVIGILILKKLKAKNMKPLFYLSIGFMLSIGLFALPISKVHIQENYKPISELSVINLPLYSLESVSPEMIYNYGDKIPSISVNEGFALPAEQEFGVVTNTLNPKTIEPLSKFYTIKFIGTYDLNTSQKNSRSYKLRLVNKVYKLTLK